MSTAAGTESPADHAADAFFQEAPPAPNTLEFFTEIYIAEVSGIFIVIVLLVGVAAFTMTSPERDVGQLAPLFERIMASVRFNATASNGNGS